MSDTGPRFALFELLTSWRRFASFVVSCALWPAGLTAQDGGRFQHGEQIPGRPPVAVQGMVQDRFAFLWFGSEDGLYRYDGYSSRVYRHENEVPGSLSSSNIAALLEDRQGDLWVATIGGGLDRYVRDRDQFEHFRHDPNDPASLAGDNVWCLLEDTAGVLWAGAGGGLHRLDRAAGTFTRYLDDLGAEAGGIAVLALYEDQAGALWAGTSGGLVRFETLPGPEVPATPTVYRHDPADPTTLSHDRIRAILGDGEGGLWIGTEQGLNRFDPRRGTFRRYLHEPEDPTSLTHDQVSDLHRDARGRLWIATFGGGLDRYDPATGGFEHFRNDPSDPNTLSANAVVEIYEDRGGVLWFGTWGGLNKYDPHQEQFSRFARQTLGAESLALAVWAEPSGVLWIGSIDRLVRVDRRRRTTVRYLAKADTPGALPPGYITALWKDETRQKDETHEQPLPDGALWIGTWGGLCRLDERRGWFDCHRHDPDDPTSLPDDSVLALFEDRQGRLWVGTAGGAGVFDRDRRRFRAAGLAGAPQALSRQSVDFITQTRSGDLWFATDNGLFRVGESSQRYRHDPLDADSLIDERICTIHEDRQGNLWIGTFGGGLDRFDRDRGVFEHYSTRDGLPSDMVTGILEDDDGVLWLGTYQGLSRFDPRAGTFRNYDMSDGLAGNVLNVYSYFRGADGEMFFGTDHGLSSFFPAALADDPDPPPVVLTELHLFDKPVPLRSEDPDSPLTRPIFDTRELVFDHRQGVFAFEFAALAFRNPEKNRYAYQLEGFDRDWIETSPSQRFARYTNLDARSYVFRVKASNADGVWNEEGTSVAVTVLPPPWKTWWAYSLYVLALLAGSARVVTGQRRKLARERQQQRLEIERERQISRRLREVDRLKDEFLANTSHELRTPLYGMTGLAESLADGARGELPEAVRADLSMIAASGQRLTHLVGDILDFSKLRHKSLELRRGPVDLKPLTEVVLTLSRPLVGAKDLELSNSVPADLPAADADENRLQQILYNLVGNAIKFTASGTVEVSASACDGMLEVRVADTGIGIAPADQERIFDAFEQADASVDREHGGTGLGLAVTRRLVELHGGMIALESTPGGGSTFTFSLPTASTSGRLGEPSDTADRPAPRSAAKAHPVAENVPMASATANVDGEASGEGPRVLVVDDEPVNLQVVRNFLAVEKFQLTLAPSGEEALRRLEEERFDLVLLDVMMPRVSGYEVCRALRENHSISDLPVIFLTARTQDSDVVAGMEVGANDYLTKPITKDRLLARVRPHLDLLQVHRNLEDLVEEKVSRVQVLEGLLPICAACKKVRDDDGRWTEIEVYVRARSQAEFSHGVCPECAERLYGEYFEPEDSEA